MQEDCDLREQNPDDYNRDREWFHHRPSAVSVMSQDISVAFFGLDWIHAHEMIGKEIFFSITYLNYMQFYL